eukprot:gene209-biopygen1057
MWVHKGSLISGKQAIPLDVTDSGCSTFVPCMRANVAVGRNDQAGTERKTTSTNMESVQQQEVLRDCNPAAHLTFMDSFGFSPITAAKRPLCKVSSWFVSVLVYFATWQSSEGLQPIQHISDRVCIAAAVSFGNTYLVFGLLDQVRISQQFKQSCEPDLGVHEEDPGRVGDGCREYRQCRECHRGAVARRKTLRGALRALCNVLRRAVRVVVREVNPPLRFAAG